MTSVILKVENKLISQWKSAKWSDYLVYRDDLSLDFVKLFFNNNHLLVEMGSEGINHAQFCDLLTMMLGFWFAKHPDQIFSLYSRCQIEKPNYQAAAPDLLLYLGDNYPTWQSGEKRYINLEEMRVPDLVGEVGDTTLASDLDQKKHLYEVLGIPEYWVIDVRGKRIIAFLLDEEGVYQEITQSQALKGLNFTLIEATFQRLETESNGKAAIWFSQQLGDDKIKIV
jgi:Uma2 family endonuclease